MKCPYCGYLEDKVIDSRASSGGEAVRRRRECLSCSKRFTTYEQVEETRIMVIKKDNRRELFDREKIINGMIIACRKRPVSLESLESIVDEIERQATEAKSGEITSNAIGEMVADSLKRLDQVAYIRFASVYRQFEDVGQFKELLNSEL